MSNESTGIVRRARMTDHDEILAIINGVWRQPDGSPGDIAGGRPFLFGEERISNHWVYEVDGRLWGVLGAYPYDVRFSGVRFRMAGIGQVICVPEFRGRGVMTALLKQAIAGMEADGYDAAWLAGDRRRYGHFGWAPGGRALHFTTNPRYLPDPATVAAEIRPLDIQGEFDRLASTLDGLPDAILIPPLELRQLCAGWKMSGWALRRSFIVVDAKQDHVLFADGEPAEIALLIAHQQRLLVERGAPAQMFIETACRPSPLLRTCREIAANASIEHCASFRIVRLVSFLDQATRMVEGAVPQGVDQLELCNSDTGEVATLSAAHGRIQVDRGAVGAPGAGVTAGSDHYAVRLDTTQLSELFFDWLPAEMHLPHLRADSPLRALFPLNVFMPRWQGFIV
jgi:GNAT superfamily N-acetyltransferase